MELDFEKFPNQNIVYKLNLWLLIMNGPSNNLLSPSLFSILKNCSWKGIHELIHNKHCKRSWLIIFLILWIFVKYALNIIKPLNFDRFILILTHKRLIRLICFFMFKSEKVLIFFKSLHYTFLLALSITLTHFNKVYIKAISNFWISKWINYIFHK